MPDTPFKDDDIINITRVGKYNSSKSRMVVVKFANAYSKSKIFASRDQLRAKGIRVSNDLTQFQRQKLKELSQRGIFGYYKNGILHQREPKSNTNSRTFVHAKRRGNQSMEVPSNSPDINEPVD